MLNVARDMGLNSGTWTRFQKISDARSNALSFSDVRLTVMGCDGLYWVVPARHAAKLRNVGHEII